MTGQQLYAIYVLAMLEQGVGIDTWDELEPNDRKAWDRVAEQVEPKEIAG